MIGKYVIVRTYSAGVHIGTLQSRSGTEVALTGARRIWSWTDANTLHEISLHGVGKESRVSEPVEQILLTEAIEIIPATAEAEANLQGIVWAGTLKGRLFSGSGSGSGSAYGDGSGSGSGSGSGGAYGEGSGSGLSYAYGDGSGDGSGSGFGYGSGDGFGDGSGDGFGFGFGN